MNRRRGNGKKWMTWFSSLVWWKYNKLEGDRGIETKIDRPLLPKRWEYIKKMTFIIIQLNHSNWLDRMASTRLIVPGVFGRESASEARSRDVCERFLVDLFGCTIWGCLRTNTDGFTGENRNESRDGSHRDKPSSLSLCSCDPSTSPKAAQHTSILGTSRSITSGL
jgi:hypothetical protein